MLCAGCILAGDCLMPENKTKRQFFKISFELLVMVCLHETEIIVWHSLSQ